MASLRLGTRGSALALAQAETVADALRALSGSDVELVRITTRGDSAPGAGEDKSRWVAEIEQALLARRIDLAVHSAKDVPIELAEGLAILATPPRADARDALCLRSGAPSRAELDALAPGARVGTSSLRRRSQLRALRPDLEVIPLRGNVDTRLRRLAAGELDAIVIARAGLVRLGRSDEAGASFDVQAMVPAPGQGTLVLQGRAGDAEIGELAQALDDPATRATLRAERALVAMLEADCMTPVGAHARWREDGRLELDAFVGLPDGGAWLRDHAIGEDDEELGGRVAERMLAAGAGELLAAARSAEVDGARA